MKGQFESSITHRQHIDSGWVVKNHREFGQGDSAVSVIEYGNGSVWTYDNGSATPQFDVTFEQVCLACSTSEE